LQPVIHQNDFKSGFDALKALNWRISEIENQNLDAKIAELNELAVGFKKLFPNYVKLLALTEIANCIC
jgi:hypothetical protein